MAGNSYVTASRKKILEFLKNNSDRTVTAADIDAYLKQSGGEVNITTVYRYLDKLVKDGSVLKYVAEKGSQTVYQYVEQGQQCERHLHLKCVRCGRIIHLDCTFMDEISNHILNDHGFVLQCRNSILYGTCRACAGKDGNAASEPIGLAQGWQEIARRMQVELEHFARGGQGSSDLSMQLAFANRERQDYSVFLKRFAAMLREQMHVDLDTFDYNYYSYGLHLYGNMPLVEPLEYRETKVIRSFAIVLDTSGSVDRSLLEKFLQKTYDCLLSEESFAGRFAVHIVQADCKVQSDICIHSAQELQEYLRALTIRGRGGTDFHPALEYVEKLQKDGSLPDLKGALYFTDGEGTFPERKPPFEVAFVYVGEEAFRAKVPAWALKVVFSEDDDGVKIV